MDLRRCLRSADLPTKANMSARYTARMAARFLFIAGLATLISLSVTAEITGIAVGASVLVAQMLYVILPVQRIRAKARYFATGEAGDAFVDEVEERGGFK